METNQLETLEQENSNLVRVNIRINKKLKKYFETKSNETGIPQSCLMAIALEFYVDYKQMLDNTNRVVNLEQLVDSLPVK